MDDALQRYTRAAVDGDRAGATRIVRALEHDGVAPSRIIRELLALSQAEVGLGWQRFRTSVEHERQATSIANAMLSSLHDPAEHQRLSRGRLVMLCAAGDRHEMPARMAARLLAQQGWQVTNLGVAEPTTELIDAVMTLEPSIVGVSCALPANLVGAAATVAALRARGLRVLAGGRAFGTSAHRARAIGANGWITAAAAGFDLDDVVWDEPALPDVDGPWAPMTARRREIARRALDVLASVEPEALGLAALGQTALDELSLIVSAVAAADLCGDAHIVREHRAWLGDRMRSVGADESAVDAAFLAVAAAVRAELPTGAAMLLDVSMAPAP
jgi:methanogenic corrinoid protein MtbC1